MFTLSSTSTTMNDNITQSLKLTNSNSSKARKQQSPFRNIRNSLKLRSNKNKTSEAQALTYTDLKSSKLRNGLPTATNATSNSSGARTSTNSRKNQRLSAQRVTLFKYEHVKVMNYQLPELRRNSGSSVSTVASQLSTMSSHRMAVNNLENNSAETNFNNHKTLKNRSTSLISSGPLEIYQIITPNLKTPPQKMTYLCLGRKGNVVHPILPRLQITKLNPPGFKILLLLFNPERYWEIEFLSPSGEPDIDLQIITDFENVIGGICNYVKNEITVPSLGENSTFIDTSCEASDRSDEENEEDALEYLLEDSDDSENETTSVEDVSTEFLVSQGLNGMEQDISFNQTMINNAFRRAMHNIKPLSTSRYYENSLHKRFSSYHDTIPKISNSFRCNRRSISVPFDFQHVKQVKTELVPHGSWMDIEFEDVEGNI